MEDLKQMLLLTNGEVVKLTGKTRNLGHGVQCEVIYQDESTGFEHEEDLETIIIDESKVNKLYTSINEFIKNTSKSSLK